MSARTLPVTPAERACATVLRAFITWNLDGTREVMTLEYGAMLKLGDFLSAQGLTIEDVGDPTDAGAALLARVEAAERTPETAIDPDFAKHVWTATIKDRIEDDAPIMVAVVSDGTTYQPRFFGLGKWRDPAPDFGYRILAAWALAGTTPIDAPPAKEPAPLLPIRACKHPRATGDCYSCPDCGVINNCNLENGEPEAECQMCPGKCPNRAQYAAKEPR